MKPTSQAPRRAAAGRKPAQRAWRQKNGKAVRSRTACRGRVSL